MKNEKANLESRDLDCYEEKEMERRVAAVRRDKIKVSHRAILKLRKQRRGF